jgi:hypothetical protein
VSEAYAPLCTLPGFRAPEMPKCPLKKMDDAKIKIPMGKSFIFNVTAY